MSNFTITVTEVGRVSNMTKGKAKWTEFVVKYTGDKGDKEKKFMSFDNAQYALGQSLIVGGTYDVALEKEGDYFKWTAAAPMVASAPKAVGSTSIPVSAYAERDSIKQLLIVRQSMVKAAVDFLNANGDSPSQDDVVRCADFFVNYVQNGLEEDVTVDEVPTDDQEEVASHTLSRSTAVRGRPRKVEVA